MAEVTGVTLVADVGNTETVIGLFRPDSLEVLGRWRYATPVPRTPDELRLLLGHFLEGGGFRPEEVRRVVVGSVVPVQTELLGRALGSMGRGDVRVVGGSEDLPIRLDVDEPRTVGADRIANTLAASHLFRRDTIVVDFGTATTYDVITADGVFLGGVIAPGLQAGHEWLAGRTAKLPRVELAPPERVIGRRTETCVQSGIFYSAVEAVDGVVERIRDEWDRPDPLIVATGGNASQVVGHSRCVTRVEPDLTLVGLELAGRHLGPRDPAG